MGMHSGDLERGTLDFPADIQRIAQVGRRSKRIKTADEFSVEKRRIFSGQLFAVCETFERPLHCK
jgi:hypothetical protein